MLLGCWLIFFALLTMFFSHHLEHKKNPNRVVDGRITKSGDRIVTLYRNDRNQYLSAGKVNGQAVTYLIDTGATGISIPTSVAKKAGLRTGRSGSAATANGFVTIYETRVDKLELGPIVVRNVPAHINPGLTDNQILLGISVLRKLDIRIKGRKMTLRQPAR